MLPDVCQLMLPDLYPDLCQQGELLLVDLCPEQGQLMMTGLCQYGQLLKLRKKKKENISYTSYGIIS